MLGPVAAMDRAPAADLLGRRRRHPARHVAGAERQRPLVEDADDGRGREFEHAAGNELVAGRGVAPLQGQQVPVLGSRVGPEPRRWQQQPARHLVGHEFPRPRQHGARVDAQLMKDPVRQVLADLVGQGPLAALGAGLGPEQDGGPGGPAPQPAQAHVAGTPRLRSIHGHRQAGGPRELKGVDRRAGHCARIQQSHGHGIQSGGQLFRGDSREHGFVPRGTSRRRSPAIEYCT